MEGGKVLSEILTNPVCPLTFIGNYFYNTGKFTVTGSPYSLLENEYMLFEWLKDVEDIGEETPYAIILIGVEFGYISPAVRSEDYNNSINLLTGRSSARQKYFDAITRNLLREKENQHIKERSE